MNNECYEYTIPGRYDTGGRLVYGWKCYCGTTACLKKVNVQNLAEIITVTQKRIDELTPEEEERFYKKVFDRHV